MEKWIAAFLQAGGAALFFTAGLISDEVSLLVLVPAAASSISGMLLWGRAQLSRPPTPVPLAPANPARPLESKVDRIEDTLSAVQRELIELREDREFMRELYAGAEPQGRVKG